MSKNDDYFNERDWGRWLVLAMQPGYKVKKITIEPKMAISKQFHEHRAEYWTIFEGKGEVLLDKSLILGYPCTHQIPVNIGDHLKIDKKVIHKVTNTGDKPLIILEIQMGEYCSEEDITRLD